MKRSLKASTILAALAAALLLSACGEADTETATNVTSSSARLNANVSCDLGDWGTFWMEIELPETDPPQPGPENWNRVGNVNNYNCTAFAGSTEHWVNATGLDSCTSYAYRVVGTHQGSGDNVEDVYIFDSDGHMFVGWDEAQLAREEWPPEIHYDSVTTSGC